MKFSRRLPHEIHANTLAGLLAKKRARGARIFDLTESNPTNAGIQYPAGFLAGLTSETAMRYEPEPFGMPSARERIGAEYGTDPSRIVLTASTSEAYSWLFKLFCDPGDEVLIPRPSYPLFDYLAALESVETKHYGLFYDHGWFIDFHTLENAISKRTRAVVLVNPNNPTGHFIRRHEVDRLAQLGLPIISDEVFQDYLLEPAEDSVRTVRGFEGGLTFSLNGLSKAAGLPQMKLAWMIASGPADQVEPALERLEIIADTYLSVGTPVQCGLDALLRLRSGVQEQIMRRLRANQEALRESGLQALDAEAGWYAIVRLEEGAELSLLEEHNVLVQPGYFYDFENPSYAVISLLTESSVFQEGVTRIAQRRRG
jgi:aspartate/methionine/tyrosine aminotransferase